MIAECFELLNGAWILGLCVWAIYEGVKDGNS